MKRGIQVGIILWVTVLLCCMLGALNNAEQQNKQLKIEVKKLNQKVHDRNMQIFELNNEILQVMQQNNISEEK